MKKQTIAITIIILFHVVGLIGFCIPATQALFVKIVPYHLLLMFGLIEYSHQKLNKPFFIFVLIIFVLGFTVEWLGVHTHLIFGNYVYGKTLGLKVLDIPLLIGVNWFLLIYGTGVLMQWSGIKNLNVRVITGAIILVLLDMLIEPIATRFDYWHWYNFEVPPENYLGWFIVSGLMLGIFEAFKFTKQSLVGAVLVLAQFVFFAAMHAV